MKNNRAKTTISKNRWSKYVVAGAATAICLGGAGQETLDAEITVVDVNASLGGLGTISYFGPYLVGGGSSGFLFAYFPFNSGGALRIDGDPLLSFAGFTATFNSNTYRYASNLPYGQVVSQVPTFLPTSPTNEALMAFAPGYPSSQFLDAGRSFVGFRFDLGNGTQYGYAEVIMDGNPLNTATFVRYAWADPGESIRAGQIPEPGTLGFLALGCVGVLAWRRKRALQDNPRLQATGQLR